MPSSQLRIFVHKIRDALFISSRSPQYRTSKSSSALRRSHSDSMKPFSPSSVSTSFSSPSSVVVTLLVKVLFLFRGLQEILPRHILFLALSHDSLSGKVPFTVPSKLAPPWTPCCDHSLYSSCIFTCSTLPWARGHDFASRRLSPRGVCAPWFSSSSQSRFQIN